MVQLNDLQNRTARLELRIEQLRIHLQSLNRGSSEATEVSSMLFGMLRAIRPKRVVEVGSGYSSALLLDTNERFLGGSVSCIFIEPYPQLLYKLIRDSDRRTIEVIASGVQKVPLERFTALTSGDILFIDSTHVSKIGSDVNYLFFEVLPALSAGVWIHVHDVLWPFDYPREWITEGRAWNESYLLRAFLQFNPVFRIELFLDFLLRFHPEPFRASMPVALQRPGASLWLRKVL